MLKWEYCAVGGICKQFDKKKFDTISPVLWNFTTTGVKAVEIADSAETARVIAQLGEEGWEMVGCGSTIEGDSHVLYFKRPKQY